MRRRKKVLILDLAMEGDQISPRAVVGYPGVGGLIENVLDYPETFQRL